MHHTSCRGAKKTFPKQMPRSCSTTTDYVLPTVYYKHILLMNDCLDFVSAFASNHIIVLALVNWLLLEDDLGLDSLDSLKVILRSVVT